eukprot:CAMPEP_0117039722 /NCGR_PEP_ID=MMETSP0472-20121206/27857_1 /TAXON_ID=693140 ORGANISM="Tiarina fusus, Strain LIS" /NCGR_SAMPLE_ID=MMETSP0472 /ASSEMBLY_ACC=CAM_ASM_000603 /LENGTH=357 /DNA_ID=CAMNT_0004750285 /DNA_START=87 /DNA_END=1156 /DNA_ORIENTATION=+
MPGALELIGNVLLFALVFGMSATVDIKCMKQQIQNKNAILLGLFCQFLLLPFLGFAMVNLLQLDAALGMTLLVVTSSPGGSYSNWWCSLFNADLALSVTMTAISTILSIIALPANLLIYANISYEADITKALDWHSVFVALAIVITAIALGLYLSYKTHSYKFNVIANKIGNVAGLALIIFSAAVTNTGDSDTKIWSREPSFYIACIGPCVLGLLIASLLASALNLEKPERMTVAVECCYQNVGIATSLALTMFEGNDLNHAMGIPFFYGICEAALVGSYCIACWKAGWSKAPADAPIWDVVFRTYEVLEAEKQEVCEVEISVSSGSEDSLRDRQEGAVFHKFFEMEDSPMSLRSSA